ncbi:MAG TPA: SHOCT domain-containing protein [Candidatus Absconditabacterales bacterium]|nr:SHOCT domain-containing protein [Candidatus Absconditabacterales bacterium]
MDTEDRENCCSGKHKRKTSPGDELKHRYAKGEISKKEYQNIKKEIEE